MQMQPQTERDQAIEIARRVLREGELGVNLNTAEAELLAREFLRSLGLRREGLQGGGKR